VARPYLANGWGGFPPLISRVKALIGVLGRIKYPFPEWYGVYGRFVSASV
jgi:hypothetical protein